MVVEVEVELEVEVLRFFVGESLGTGSAVGEVCLFLLDEA